MNTIVDTFDKKQMCLLVGPNCSSKKYLMFEAYKTAGIGPIETYYSDLLNFETFFGRF